MTEDVLFQEERFSPARLLTRPKLLLAIVAASIVVLAGTVVGVGMIPAVDEEVIGPQSLAVAAQEPNRDRGPGAIGEAAATTEDRKPASLTERLKRGIAKLGKAFKRGFDRIRRAPRAIFRSAGVLIDRTFDSDGLTFDDLTEPLVEILRDPVPTPIPSPPTSPLPSPFPSPSPSPSVATSPSPSPAVIQPSPSPSPVSSPSASASPSVPPSPSPATSPSPSA